jgi:hypothetical protein
MHSPMIAASSGLSANALAGIRNLALRETYFRGCRGMVKNPKEAPQADIEFLPDAMERFERAVRVVAKTPPQHRVAKKKKTAKKSKKKSGE